MLRPFKPIPFLLTAILCLPVCLRAQAPEEAYAVAHKIFLAHSQTPGFGYDNSPEGIQAAQHQWSAVADFIAEKRKQNPSISPNDLSHELCLLTVEPLPPESVQQSPAQQCAEVPGGNTSVVELQPHLLLMAPSIMETGTVFLMSERDGKATILWSIAEAGPQRADPDDLIGAWKLDRASWSCRDKEGPHKPGSCGPLYASVVKLPADDKHRFRFYVDAGYMQTAGSTIGKQTSIWTWDGAHAELQWISWYDYMINQHEGTSFDKNDSTLVIGQKGYFRTFFDCGSCIERPMEQRVLVTKSGVEDLGIRSLVPEMDVIDNFIRRIAHSQSTASIASPQATAFLRKQVVAATKESRKISPGYDSLGMVGHVTRITKTGAEVCFQADGLDSASILVQLRRTIDNGYFIDRISQPTDPSGECPSGAFFAPDELPGG